MSERIALLVEYDGTDFYGWQAQPHLRTIQGSLQEAIYQLAQHKVDLVCAGRTDKGVHASGQVVHFDTTTHRPTDKWLMGINRYLPPDIRIRKVQPVDAHFHARFSALYRSYRYTIYNQRTQPALYRHYLSWYSYPLNADNMNLAAQYLLGEHDFSSFRDSECQSLSSIRRIKEIKVYREEEKVILEITANAFLHHMVRNIVGTLLLIGNNKQPVPWIKKVLAARDRRAAGMTAAPQGLCLTHVEYPKQFSLFADPA